MNKTNKTDTSPHVIDRRTGDTLGNTQRAPLLLRMTNLPVISVLAGALLFKNGLLTRLLGRVCDSRFSRFYIPHAVKRYGLNPDEFESRVEDYHTFNEFFTRKLRPEARPSPHAEDVFVSPCDCRMTVYTDIDPYKQFRIKGQNVDLETLLQNKEVVESFPGSTVILCRLAPSDYHRFHFPTEGRIRSQWQAGRNFYSVHPEAFRRTTPILQNVRQVNILETPYFGEIGYVEVGAFGVGCIVNTFEGTDFSRMEEKGYFKIGASAIVLILPARRIVVDSDLVRNSKQARETLVRCGERIGITHARAND